MWLMKASKNFEKIDILEILEFHLKVSKLTYFTKLQEQ